METQKLIDLMFEIVLVSTESKEFCAKPRGEKMAWVANTLREFGYDTHPVGMSWGVLVSSKFRDENSIITDDLDTLSNR